MGRDRHKKKRGRELGLSGVGQVEEDETVMCYYCDKEAKNEQVLLLHLKAVHQMRRVWRRLVA